MALKEIQQNSSLDWLKWLIAVALLAAGFVANYFYTELSWPLRLLAWLILLGVIAAVLSQTALGRRVLIFARESQMELRKVYWPTRPETIQTTLVVAGMVVVLGLALWGIDGLFMWLIGWLTGQRG